MCMVWCEVECGSDVEWRAKTWWLSDLMWIMVQCEMCETAMSVYVKSGAMWNVAISDMV